LCPFKVGQVLRNIKSKEKVVIDSIYYGWLIQSGPNKGKHACRVRYRKIRKDGVTPYKIAVDDYGSIYHNPENWEIIKGE